MGGPHHPKQIDVASSFKTGHYSSHTIHNILTRFYSTPFVIGKWQNNLKINLNYLLALILALMDLALLIVSKKVVQHTFIICGKIKKQQKKQRRLCYLTRTVVQSKQAAAQKQCI